MAKRIQFNKITRAVLGKEGMKKIGNYQESTGGGTPLEKGQKLKDHPEAHRVQQPRDEEGRFTYNSMNAKPLKYGPTRGDTMPPVLRNNEIIYCAPGDEQIKIGGVIKTDVDGKITRLLISTTIDADQVKKVFQEWDPETKEFKGLNKYAAITKKKGRYSKAEKAAKKDEIVTKTNYDISKAGQSTQSKIKKDRIEFYKRGGIK